MSVVDTYLDSLTGPEHDVLSHMYGVVRQAIPDATEELSYNMPTFKWQGKGVVSILSNKDFLSLYPFCNHDTLGIDLSMFETTKGSIHFTLEHPLSDEMLRKIIAARMAMIGRH